MHRNKTASSHQFAMIPRADIPRSSFRMEKTLKTAFDAGYLVPIFCEEVLPGDAVSLKMTGFGRLATPIFPFLDNLYLETFFFFVPNRLVWDNWEKFMGAQDNPTDSISYTIPQVVSPAGGWAIGSLADYFGLPTVGQVAGGATVSHSSLPLRGYMKIWQEWFRDENLQTAPSGYASMFDDGPDTNTWFTTLKRRGKRHDYFTSCLPWTQKGGVAVNVPITGSAPVWGTGVAAKFKQTSGTVRDLATTNLSSVPNWDAAANATGNMTYPLSTDGVASYLSADLTSGSIQATINSMRQAFQVQRLLERDARGGTRYTEMNRAHFGVVSPDARLQRPEYLGGGKTPIQINPIAQTSASNLSGGSTPLANLSAVGTTLAQGHGFSQSFTEHGYIIGLATVNADLTYQQGLRRHWSRSTRYDFYFPAFAMLGEQAVLNKEIYVRGDANDALVFGYQERWAEYRYNPSEITGLLRSTAASTIDAWHLSQKFTALPVLNDSFIQDTPPVSRVVAVGAGANGQQLLLDCFYSAKWVRPLPMYSVPGLIDHF